MFGICGTLWCDVSRFCSLPMAFLNTCPTFLASLTSWDFDCSFDLMLYLLRDCLQGIKHHCTLPSLPGFSLKSQWKFPWSQNSRILHDCKTSITWTTPSLLPTLAVDGPLWTMAPVTSKYLEGWTWSNTFLCNLCQGGSPKPFLKHSFSNEFTHLQLEPVISKARLTPEMPTRHPSYSPSANYMASFYLNYPLKL
jgi:hypothetical protein